jgi:hypothetical protein
MGRGGKFFMYCKNFLQVAPPLERTLLEALEETPPPAPWKIFHCIPSELLSTLVEPSGDVLARLQRILSGGVPSLHTPLLVG